MAQVSIIIPVYNVSQYLDKCISSVIHQTFKDIEIIVVNDGSTDDSLLLLEGYSLNDDRVKIITKSNEGLAMARLTGLERATAPYVYHLDGDDFIEPTLIEQVYKKIIETEADLLMFRFRIDYPDRSALSLPYPKSNYTSSELLSYLWSGLGYFAVWAHMHKRSLYENVKFVKELSFGEDAYLTSQLIYYSDKIHVYDSEPLMHYIIRDTSISNGALSEKKAKDILLYPELIVQFMSDKKEFQALKRELYALKINASNVLLRRGWMKGARQRALTIQQMMMEYPDLKRIPGVKAFRKVNYLLAKCYPLGLLYVAYYKRKGKIAES